MQKKNDIGITLILIGSILILFGIIIILLQLVKNNISSNDYAYEFVIEKSKNCNKEAKLYYELPDGRNIYTYCIDDIEIKNSEEDDDLKDLLRTDATFIDTIITNLDYVIGKDSEIYKDGGSKILSHKDYSILNCHTLDGNRDIYIGPKGMVKENGFCERPIDNIDNEKSKSYVYDCKFTETFRVVNLLDGYKTDVPDYSFIVVDGFQNFYPKIVKLTIKDKEKLVMGKFYEFNFHLKGTTHEEITDLDYVLKNVFEEDYLDFKILLESVKETDKLGLDQISEPVCKYSKVIE